MAGRRRGKLLRPRPLPHDRPPGLQRREHAQILADDLLLAAEPAADAFGEHVNVARKKIEQVAELLL
jgi:hypothetical protein